MARSAATFCAGWLAAVDAAVAAVGAVALDDFPRPELLPQPIPDAAIATASTQPATLARPPDTAG
jgi:hypothetical protein